jgi:hypothetical protein
MRNGIGGVVKDGAKIEQAHYQLASRADTPRPTGAVGVVAGQARQGRQGALETTEANRRHAAEACSGNGR